MQTRQGWMGEEEVVEVWYDSQRTSFAELLMHGRATECARTVWTRTDAQQKFARTVLGARAQRQTGAIRLDPEQKYYLLQTPLTGVPMTEAQACRVNAALGEQVAVDGPAWRRWLSPRQLEVADRLLAQAARAAARD